jgi:starch phosphorylase
VGKFHMNEGHAALLALELFAEERKHTPDERDEAMERVRRMCVFTTHTPVPAGHDQFSPGLAGTGLDRRPVGGLARLGVL